MKNYKEYAIFTPNGGGYNKITAYISNNANPYRIARALCQDDYAEAYEADAEPEFNPKDLILIKRLRKWDSNSQKICYEELETPIYLENAYYLHPFYEKSQ